jgi:hypothetical protein
MATKQYFRPVRLVGSYRRIWIALAAVVVAAAAFSVLAQRASATPDETAIEQVVRGALIAEQTLGIPPPAYSGGVMSGAINQQMIDHVPAVLSKYYVGDPLARDVNAIQANIRADKTGKTRYLAGGVDNLQFTSVVVNGNSAIVSATATTWATFVQNQNGTPVSANPHNVTNYTFTLTKASGSWLIDSEAWSYAPGSEP